MTSTSELRRTWAGHTAVGQLCDALDEANNIDAYFRSLLNAITDIVPFAGCDYGDLVKAVEQMKRERDEARARNDVLEAALERIAQWSEAYPVTVFIPLSAGEMQFAASVLRDAGITMDAMHAGWARHIVEGIGGIARTALEPSATPPRDE